MLTHLKTKTRRVTRIAAGLAVAGALGAAPMAAQAAHSNPSHTLTASSLAQSAHPLAAHTSAVASTAPVFAPSFTAGQPISKADYPLQSYVSGHVSAVADPAGSGPAVAKFAIANNDFPYAENYAARADMLTQPWYTEGSTLYTSVPIKIPAGLPGFHNSRTSFYQFAEAKDTAASFPSWGLGLIAGADGQNHWSFGTTSNVGYPWVGPVVDGNWHTFVVQAYYTKAAGQGWLQLYMDGQPVTFNQGAFAGKTRVTGITTITDSAAAWPLVINSYRSVGTIPGTLTTYLGAPKIGTTLASVGAATVTPPPPPPPPAPLAAKFTSSSSASTVGQTVTFAGAGSTGSPVSYSWSDGTHVLGTGSTLGFTFHYTGTKHIKLTVTNANDATATVQHDLTVS